MTTREEKSAEIKKILHQMNKEFLEAGGNPKWTPAIFSMHEDLLSVVERFADSAEEARGGDGGFDEDDLAAAGAGYSRGPGFIGKLGE